MATAVLMGFEKAESTMSWAPISEVVDDAGFVRAAADTMQIRLKPSTPAANTVSGAEYLRIYNSYLSTFNRLRGMLLVGNNQAGSCARFLSAPSIAPSGNFKSGRL
jgi:hypothetical protein